LEHAVTTLTVTVERHSPASPSIRFGVFQLDLDAGELRKRGIRIKIQDQPFRILALLLEQPGSLVTREQLREMLWPHDTFVEFEHGINAAVAKLRQALGDSAENPRFVETVAKRGYKFISAVEIITTIDPADPIAGNAPVPEPPSRKASGRRLVVWGLGGATLVAGIAAVIAIRSGQTGQTPALTALHRITSDQRLSVDPVVSRDGTLLAYASDRGGQGNLDIWVQQRTGSSPVQLTFSVVDEHEPAFSPDGTQIAFRSEREGGGIYVIPALGGEARLIARQGQNPRFSPDGKLIAYWIGPITTTIGPPNSGTVHLIPVTGGSPQPLTTDLSEAGHPVWSSDGKQLIVFGVRVQPQAADPEIDWWIVPRTGGKAKATRIVGDLQKQGFQYPGRVCEWTNDTILFAGMRGDPVNLWRLTVNRETGRLTGPPRRLTSGNTFEIEGNITPDGHLIYAALDKNYNIWSLPLRANEGVATGEMKKLTDRTTREAHPSISSDGRYLAYASTRTGDRDIWVQDLLNGKETPLAATSHWEEHPQISRDGELIAYSTDLPGRSAGTTAGTYVVRRSGGVPEKVCEGIDCGFAWDWSLDNTSMLAGYFRGPFSTIDILALHTRQRTKLLHSDKYDVYQARFSPDGRWVLFAAGRAAQSRLFIAPVREGAPIAEKEWIAVADRDGWCNKPRWSPAGSLIYFVSRRDGYYCLWAQRVTPSAKQPAGAPFNVAHFHQTHLSMMNVAEGPLEISVAQDKIVFNLSELTGSIWAGEFR
jgi:eukaryotic-like serine/threonine-protein kinase